MPTRAHAGIRQIVAGGRSRHGARPVLFFLPGVKIFFSILFLSLARVFAFLLKSDMQNIWILGMMLEGFLPGELVSNG